MIDLLFNRRSIRQFSRQVIEAEKTRTLVQAALLSPSSRALRPWEFIVVDDAQVLEKLSRAKKHGSGFLKSAPLCFVIIADPGRCDVWIEDASIATIILQLTAESLGLSSCWIQIRERMHDISLTAEIFVRDTLGIPEQYRVLSMIGIGYAAEPKIRTREDELAQDKVHHNRFATPFGEP